MSRLRRWLRYRKYRRRQLRLEFVLETCGMDVAVKFGEARGWIDRYDGERIWLAE